MPQGRIIHAEDGTGLAVLTSPDVFFRRRTDVFVNGLGQSSDSIHRRALRFLAWCRSCCIRRPKTVAIIGLGSGDTAYSAAGRPETETLDCVEIVGGQIQTLRELYERTGYPGLGGLLQDPRIRFVVGDGRRYVMQSRERFDVIEADALRPSSAVLGQSLLARVLRAAAKPAQAGRFGRHVGADITDSAHLRGCFSACRGDPADVDRQQPADRHRR